MARKRMIYLFLLLSVLKIRASKSKPDNNNCSCSPSSFKLRINIHLGSCSTQNIQIGPSSGIHNSFCEIRSYNPYQTTEDYIPITIDTVRIYELSKVDLSIARHSVFENIALKDGDQFTFRSIVSSDYNEDGAAAVGDVGGLQLSLSGVNSKGILIVNNFILMYSGVCGMEPFDRGHAFGWVIFEGLGPPPDELCSLPSPSLFPIVRNNIPSTRPTNNSGNYIPTVTSSTTATEPKTIHPIEANNKNIPIPTRIPNSKLQSISPPTKLEHAVTSKKSKKKSSKHHHHALETLSPAESTRYESSYSYLYDIYD